MTPSSLTWGAGRGKDTNQRLLADNDLSTVDLKEEKEFTYCVLGKAISESQQRLEWDHSATATRGCEWWCNPLIPAIRRQRQVDLCDLEASCGRNYIFYLARI